eukprot:677643-Rhodomonas_salina.7
MLRCFGPEASAVRKGRLICVRESARQNERGRCDEADEDMAVKDEGIERNGRSMFHEYKASIRRSNMPVRVRNVPLA